MQGKLVILSGLVFSGVLAINGGPAYSQTGGTGSKSSQSGQKGTGSSTDMQKPTDPPAGTSRGKSGDSLGAPSGQSSQDKSGSSSGAQMGQRSKEDIKQVQEALKSKGHDPGTADGIMGPKTQQAIRAFQKETGSQPTGRLDEKTASALGVEKSGTSSGSEKESPSGASPTERKGSSPSGAGSSSGSPSGSGSSPSSKAK